MHFASEQPEPGFVFKKAALYTARRLSLHATDIVKKTVQFDASSNVWSLSAEVTHQPLQPPTSSHTYPYSLQLTPYLLRFVSDAGPDTVGIFGKSASRCRPAGVRS